MSLHFGSGVGDGDSHTLTRPQSGSTEPIPAAGPDYKNMMVSLQARLSKVTAAPNIRDLEEHQPADPKMAIFDNSVALKVAVSRLAMHLSDRYRIGLFREVDRLLDFENWDDNSSLGDIRSFETFLRAVLYNRIRKIPSLGISQGRILAAWRGREDAQSLYVEFLPDDRVKALLTTTGSTSAFDEFAALVAPARLLRTRLSGLGFDEAVLDADK